MADAGPLPDFDTPPLDEVVIGVQFQSPNRYTSVYADAVWQSYREEFPEVVEQPLLNPQFEVFGGNPQPFIQFGIGQPPLRNRLWFISEDDSHLIQFQDDRLLLNWRNRTNGTPYPRHKIIQEAFTDYLNRLDALFKGIFDEGLLINQAEVSYINIIPMNKISEMGHWLQLAPPPTINIEGLNFAFAEVVYDEMEKPIARLTYEVQSVIIQNGKRNAIRLALSFRGAPSNDSITAAMKFINSGREKVVSRFCDITTESAQLAWGKRL